MATARFVGLRAAALIAQNRGERTKVPRDSRRYQIDRANPHSLSRGQSPLLITDSAIRIPHFLCPLRSGRSPDHCVIHTGGFSGFEPGWTIFQNQASLG
jgi:hypothetical protein